MNLQYTRKYERVKNPKTKIIPKKKSLASSSVNTSADEVLVDAESGPVATPQTYVQASFEDGEIILEEVQCDSNDTNYIDYAVSMDELNGSFSSTTIVNGRTIACLSELQFGESPESVLVMPLDSLDDSLEAMVSNESQIRTIHVGDFDIATGKPLSRDQTFIASTKSSGNCVVQKNKAVSTKQPNWLAARLPRPLKTMITEPKMYYPDKHTTSLGGKRGLIRFGRSRMIADTHTTIAVSEFKNQLNDTSDIIGRLDLAPSTKSMMHFLNTKGVNKLFANPGRRMGAKIRRGFIRHLCIKQTEAEVTYSDMPLLPVGFTPSIDPKTIKRITRKRRYPEAEEYQRKMSNANNIKVEEEEVVDDPLYEEGNIYSDDFNPSIAIEEEQELDSFPFEDTLEENTEFSEGQAFNPSDEYTEGDEYQSEFHENKATIIMIEDENGTRESVGGPSIHGGGETQVIFYEGLEDDKEVMILPDEPCQSITETVRTS